MASPGPDDARARNSTMARPRPPRRSPAGGADRRRDRTRVLVRAAACRVPLAEDELQALSISSSPPSWCSSGARRPMRSIPSSTRWCRTRPTPACSTVGRQQLHASIAEALKTHSPELVETQPEVFAQHYAEAGLSKESVAIWGRAGHRSGARSAMVGSGRGNCKKGLDQLTLLPDGSDRRTLRRLESVQRVGRGLAGRRG